MAYVNSPYHNLVPRLKPSEASLTRQLYHIQISLRELHMSNSTYESSKELISGEQMVWDGRPYKEFTFEKEKKILKCMAHAHCSTHSTLKITGTENILVFA